MLHVKLHVCVPVKIILTYLATSTQPGSNTAPAWSKEAIVALATIFIMVLLSGLGLVWKHGLGTWAVIRCPSWFGIVLEGIYQASILVLRH
jgi:hypothetical protein